MNSKESIKEAGFDKDLEVIFLIHDFTANGEAGWIKHFAVNFLNVGKCNLISVDWQAGAEPPFNQAISNARVVSLECAAFISMLKVYSIC